MWDPLLKIDIEENVLFVTKKNQKVLGTRKLALIGIAHFYRVPLALKHFSSPNPQEIANLDYKKIDCNLVVS